MTIGCWRSKSRNDTAIERLDEAPLDAVACVAAGDDFLRRGRALAMLAPSMVVPRERNALIDVRHGDMAKVRLIGEDPFRFDPRLSVGVGAR
jgi:RES domain-containing protein